VHIATGGFAINGRPYAGHPLRDVPTIVHRTDNTVSCMFAICGVNLDRESRGRYAAKSQPEPSPLRLRAGPVRCFCFVVGSRTGL